MEARLKLFLFTTAGPTARPDYHIVQAKEPVEAQIVLTRELEAREAIVDHVEIPPEAGPAVLWSIRNI